MSDKYQIDSHKLLLHPVEVAKWYESEGDWNRQKTIYPIYIEISPYGGCNHRCTFCGVDYMGYNTINIEPTLLKERLSEMAAGGVKSVMFAGEGEPLLYPYLADVIEHCSAVGIDSSITTNFVPTNTKNLHSYIKNASWIKVSLNAGTAQTYAAIHQTKAIDFERVIQNLHSAVKIKKENNYTCTIGAQMLLLPENQHEAVTLAKICRDIGIDYLVIKPYSQHLFSETTVYEDIKYDEFENLEKALEAVETETFKVVYRSNTMQKYIQHTHAYDKCYSTPFFWAYLSANGDVYGCSAYLGQEKFCYGNINEQSFTQIWEGEKRKASAHYVSEELDIKQCRVNCRMDEVNKYLWRLKNPQAHDNFI